MSQSIKHLFYLVSPLLFASPAIAQEQIACVGILDRVNYNFYRNSSSQQQYALQKANFCSAEYDKATSAQKANIEASYKLFSGSAAGSAENIREKQKSECQSNYGEFWYNQANLSEQKVAVTEALDTVTKCMQLAQDKKLAIRTNLTADSKQVDFIIRWNDAGDLKVNYAGPVPWNNFKCYVKGTEIAAANDLSVVIPSATEWTFSCIRPSKKITIGQDEVNCVEPANIVVNTDRVAESISLPRICETDYLISRAKQLETRMDGIENSLSTTQADVKTLNSVSQGLKSSIEATNGQVNLEKLSVKYTFAHQSVGCPGGWSDLGYAGFILRNDAYGNNLGGGGALNPGWTWTHPKLCLRN